MKQFAEIIRDYTHSNSKIVYLPKPQDDPSRRKPDISRAKSLIGYALCFASARLVRTALSLQSRAQVGATGLSQGRSREDHRLLPQRASICRNFSYSHSSRNACAQELAVKGEFQHEGHQPVGPYGKQNKVQVPHFTLPLQ